MNIMNNCKLLLDDRCHAITRCIDSCFFQRVDFDANGFKYFVGV